MKQSINIALKSPKTAIVIINWNGWSDTIECLESLCNLSSAEFAVIVVDNASQDESRQKLLAWGRRNHNLAFAGVIEQSELDTMSIKLAHKQWLYLQSANNGGFSYGNNLGIRLALLAGCEYVWLLNNDTVVEPHALTALIEHIEAVHEVGMCGSILRFYDDRNIIQAIGGVNFNFLFARGNQLGQGLPANDPRVTSIAAKSPTYIAGASMLLTSEFIRDVGLMEESYFLYFEEIDWAVRARPHWKTAIAIDSIVYHKEGASIGTDSRAKRSQLSQYYLQRNLIRFYMLRKAWLLPIVLLISLKDLFKLIMKQDWLLTKVTVQALFDGLMMKSGKFKG